MCVYQTPYKTTNFFRMEIMSDFSASRFGKVLWLLIHTQMKRLFKKERSTIKTKLMQNAEPRCMENCPLQPKEGTKIEMNKAKKRNERWEKRGHLLPSSP